MDQSVSAGSRRQPDGIIQRNAELQGDAASDARDLIDLRARPASPAPKPSDEQAGEKDAPTGADDDANDGDDKRDGDNVPKDRFRIVREHPYLSIGAVVLLVAALIGGTLWYVQARHFETTDDAFVDARQFSVAPRVAGVVTEVHVADNKVVREGDILFQIDPRDYNITVAQQTAALEQAEAQIGNVDAQIESQKAQVEVAEAQLQQANAALVFAQQEEGRALELVQRGAGTLQTEQQRRSSLTQAQADLARSKASLSAAQTQIASLRAQRRSAEANRDAAAAQLDQAKLNLSYTEVRAAQPGTIARLTGAVGQYVQVGQAVTMYVPDRLWVTANFKETQITDMRPGQKVDLRIDAYPGRKIEGHVDSIQPGSGTAFSLLPAENATGNYVKVVQRVPVKIVFDTIPDDVTLGPGMSVVPRVRVR